MLAITGMRLRFGGREDPVLSFEAAFPVHNLGGALLVLLGLASFAQNLFSGDTRQYLGKPGVWWFATAHHLSPAAIITFLIGHLYLTTMGDKVGYLIRAMFAGWHKHHVQKKSDQWPVTSDQRGPATRCWSRMTDH